ncbi:MAG TPA: nucleotide exchange factor GrpE, partial [Mogibacterium sp.]|nr:nucleotide exchange factor GrpE [Mogibacterium sp.]
MSKKTKKVTIDEEEMNTKQDAGNLEEEVQSEQDESEEKTQTDVQNEVSDSEPEDSAEKQETERYLRLMAEFQNFKKRVDKEKKDIRTYGNENIMSELLPVLDNFERALETEHDDISGYVKGMELIFQQLKTALEHAGLKEIEALGEEFDPTKHNAVMTEESDEHEAGKVGKVLQKGYTLKDKV